VDSLLPRARKAVVAVGPPVAMCYSLSPLSSSAPSAVTLSRRPLPVLPACTIRAGVAPLVASSGGGVVLTGAMVLTAAPLRRGTGWRSVVWLGWDATGRGRERWPWRRCGAGMLEEQRRGFRRGGARRRGLGGG